MQGIRAFLATLVFTLCLNGVSGLYFPGEGYNQQPKSVAYRQQTEALLAGRLSIADHPFGHEHDWGWGKGLHQLWGLGVPLLRLPFEAGARLLGFEGFPDRLTVLFWVGLCFWLLLGELAPRLPGRRFGEAGLLTTFVVASPIPLGMIRLRFLVYEEAIFYGQIWALILLALVLRAARKNGESWVLVVAAAAAAIGVFIRPTLALYGAVSMLCLMVIGWRKGHGLWQVGRNLAPGVCVYILITCALLASNALRFGHPLEFGYSMNLSFDPINDFALRFGYPFSRASFGEASLELLGALFFLSGYSDFSEWGLQALYRHSDQLWQSPLFRFRDFDYRTVELFWAWIALWGGGILAFGWRRRVHGWRSEFLLCGWGLAAFTLLFAFYLRSPSVASRYFVDFATALSALALGGYLFLVSSPHGRWSGWIGRGMLVACLSTTLFAHGTVDEFRFETGGTLAQAQAAIRETEGAPQPLPLAYRCGPTLDPKGIRGNLVGWERPTCAVAASTSIFFPSRGCVEIVFEATENSADEMAVAMKSGLDFMRRTLKERDEEGRHRQLFCPKSRLEDERIELVTIGWVRPEFLSVKPPPFRLLAVRRFAQTD